MSDPPGKNGKLVPPLWNMRSTMPACAESCTSRPAHRRRTRAHSRRGIQFQHGAADRAGPNFRCRRTRRSPLRSPVPRRPPSGAPFPAGAARDREVVQAAVQALRKYAPRRVFAGGHSYGGPQTRVVKESSDSGVKLKQAAESVAAANGPAFGNQRYIGRREEEEVALTLVVPFKMMMFDVFVQRPAQRGFSKQNQFR
jgi:hypothetical protein